MPSYSIIIIFVVFMAVMVQLDLDGGFAGIGAVVKLVRECYHGNEWCDSSFIPRLPKIAVSMGLDKFKESAMAIAEKHAPGKYSLTDKVVIVTGASAGCGEETARVLLAHGAHVIFAVRNVPKAKKTLQKFIDANTVSGKATIIKMDLSDLRSVESFVKEFKALDLPLHILVNNAGIMMPGFGEKLSSKQGHELQFAVNHLGHFHLTELLEEKILSSNTVSNPGRVLYLTSSGLEFWNGPGKDGLKAQIPPETRKYHPFFGYILTKSLNTLTAREQQRRWKGKSAIAMSLNPGLVGGLTGGGGPNMLKKAGAIEGAFYGWPFAHAQRSKKYGAATTIHTALAPEVVDEVRSGITYYNNYEPTVPGAMAMHPEWFGEEIAKEAWERTVKVLRA
jgi:NAD(P)-dependent dehydrogenase (short-subunit alcohol dehydrogenase family)